MDWNVRFERLPTDGSRIRKLEEQVKELTSQVEDLQTALNVLVGALTNMKGNDEPNGTRW